MPIDTVLNSQANKVWTKLQWKPSTEQFKQFITLQELLKEWNKKVNLTCLTEGNDFWISQILDSLWPLTNELTDQAQNFSIIDVGTGCGLPGLALAIAFPNASITLVDSIKKKTCLLYTSPSPRDLSTSRMPSSA